MSVLINGVSKTVKHEINQQECGFLGMLLRTLRAAMLGNMLNGKCFSRTGTGYNNMDHIDKFF